MWWWIGSCCKGGDSNVEEKWRVLRLLGGVYSFNGHNLGRLAIEAMMECWVGFADNEIQCVGVKDG